MKSSTKTKFVYKPRAAETFKKRAQGNSLFDTYIKDGVTMLSVKAGKHRLRILPPTWDNADHYGYDVWLNYQIGADKQSYLSLSKMKKGKDFIAEERQKATADGREEDAKALQPGRRILVWAIDRKHENEGPKLWAMPATVDKEIVARAFDETTGAAINLDDPNDGYDISFTKDGEGLKTRYVGVEIARSSTPLSDNDEDMNTWLDYIAKNPIPSVLKYYTYEHIKAVFNGEAEEVLPEANDDVVPTPRNAVRKASVEVEDEDTEQEIEDEIEDEVEPEPVVPVKPTNRLQLRARARKEED